ncbi:MAG: hypothetical protein LBI38_05990 [Oscillospiraceae bacterium]|jgi:superfamily I DNA and/or RNA helicase|nr:hypothetical protein [Oscillospiraceae bacterium]
MKGSKAETAYAIVDFWHTVEFLTQNDFPKDTAENQKKVHAEEDAAKTGKDAIHDSVLLFRSLQDSQAEQIPAEDDRRFPKHMSYTKIHICVGEMEREALIQKLYGALNTEDDRPETDKSKICLIGFKVDAQGKYIEQSLQVSPVAWGVSRLIRKLEITREAYQAEMESFESLMSDTQPVTQRNIDELYNNIKTRFLEPVSFPEKSVSRKGQLIYSRYKSQKALDKADDTAKDYSALLNGFYLDDLEMIKNHIRKNKADSPMMESLLDYIVSGGGDIDQSLRIDIRNNTDYIGNCLSAANSPAGKWPSRYRPALMQQIAVNMSINRGKYEQSIFSVNGPPGTGKTTLLKEIIAANVVERAKFICRYEKADDAFVDAYFSDGHICRKDYKGYDYYYYHYHKFKDTELSDYSMLVASCNNAAVENITKELPDGVALLDGLAGEDLSEIAELFDVSKTSEVETYRDKRKSGIEKKDVYFSYPAQNMKDSKQWGLISAPLGKAKNIGNYYYKALRVIIDSQLNIKKDIEARHERYLESRARFQEQYKKVEAIKKVLGAVSCLPENYGVIKKQCLEEIQQHEKNIEQINENHRKHIQNLSEAQARRVEAELLVSEAKAALDECLSAQNACEAEIKKAEDKIKPYGDKLMELESGRRLTEVLFGKWLKTERTNQIAELKDILLKMRAELTPMRQSQAKASAAVSQAENQLLQRQNEVERLMKNISELTRKKSFFEQEIALQKQEIQKLRKKIDDEAQSLKSRLEDCKKDRTPLDDSFWEKLRSENEKISTEAQLVNPWVTKEYDRAREKLFYLALCLHKDFVLSSMACRDNFINLSLLWKYRKSQSGESGREGELCKFSVKDKKDSFGSLLNTLFLLTPVISTTFASVGRFLSAVCEPGVFGTLIIDEAGQASPHFALGALWRCRRAIVVGDPKQVEPVVTGDVDIIKKAFTNPIIKAYQRSTLSVQEFADRINRYGASLAGLENEEDGLWIGCPLVVHRRCVEPMFSISNSISYGGTMKLQTQKAKKDAEEKFILEKSGWIDIKGQETGAKNHFVKAQGEKALALITESFEKNGGRPDLFVISPFTTVIDGLKNMVSSSSLKQKHPDAELWMEECCGTVHKFQGKEAKEVIFLLGCDEKASGAVMWVKPNILNVAVTRAKYRFYVIGDYNVWKKSEIFQTAYNYLGGADN